MSCKVKKIYAPNGEPSKLFKDLQDALKSDEAALNVWAMVNTNQYKKAFGDWTSEDYPGTLDENGEPLVTEILNSGARENAEIWNVAVKKAKEYAKTTENITRSLLKMRDVLVRRIQDIQDVDSKGVEKVKERLVKLKHNLKTLDWRIATSEVINNSHASINYSKAQIAKELEKDKPNYRLVHKHFGVLTAFDVLNDLQRQIASTPAIAESFSEEEMQKLRALIEMKEGAKEAYLNHMKSRVADVLSSLSNRQDAESMEELLRVAPMDISSWERMLEFAGDAKDPVVALLAKLVNEQQQKTRHTSIEFSRTLSQKLEALERENPSAAGNPEKLFAPMLHKDKDGKLTGHFITKQGTPKQYAEFERQYKGTKMFEFYEYFASEYDRLNKLLPMVHQMGDRIPSLMKSTLDSLLASEDKLDKVKDNLKNKILATNTDPNRGHILDDSNQVVDTIPILFTARFDSAVYNKKLKQILKADPTMPEDKAESLAREYAIEQFPKQISYDLGASLQAFQYMAENYANMEEIIDVVEATKELMKNRMVVKTDSMGRVIISKLKDFEGDTLINNKQEIQGAESQSYKLIDTFIKMQVYGQTEEDLGSFSVGTAQVDKVKLAKLIQKYSSIQLLGFNILAGTANVMMGETMQWAEAIAGEHFGKKEYRAASKAYYGDTGNILGDLYARTPKSIVNMVGEHYDVLGEYHPDGTKTGSGFRRFLGKTSLFFINSVGEHMMQSRAAIAMLMKVETYDAKGNKISNLWEAHKAKEGKLNIADVYIKDTEGKLVKYDAAQQRAMSRKMQAVLRLLHGNYNKQTAATWQRDGIYNLIGQFRKWIADGIRRRYNSASYNEFMESEQEGTYRTTARFAKELYKDLKQSQLDIVANWDKLTPEHKANIKRTGVEVAIIIGMATAQALLRGMLKDLDDDEDKAKAAMFRRGIYLTNRLNTELLFFVNPFDTWDILKSPAASMSMVETTAKTMYYSLPWNWDEEYQSGKYKGKSKVGASWRRQLPVLHQLDRWGSEGIKDLVNYYNY